MDKVKSDEIKFIVLLKKAKNVQSFSPLGRDDKRCQTAEPQLRQLRPGHTVACWKAPDYEHAPPCEIPSQPSSQEVPSHD